MNIIWKKASGGIAITAMADGVSDPRDEAEAIQSSGGIPADWRAVAFDVELPGHPDSFDYVNGAFVAITPAISWAAYQAQAQTALAKSDVTILRCVESGVAVPSAWAGYRAALRAIVAVSTGTPDTLPTRPPFPTGT
ncbi:MAG: hypothetical protein JWR22_1344 [Herminiimonas sp.]|nr:hypothetical protein [Herminiimonas sp.]